MVADQINQIIEMIADKLGVAIEAVYPMLVNQAKVFCSTYHITLWITGISFVLTVLFFVLMIWKCDSHYADAVIAISVIAILVFGLVFIVAGIIALGDLHTYFTAIHNPEWWTIEYVTNLVK